MWRISDSNEESVILEKIKRRRQCDNQTEQNDENEVCEDKLNFTNVKSLTVSSITLQILSLVPDLLEKAAAKSRKEVAKLRKAFKAGLKPPPIPDGIVGFLLQNSPSAKVDFTTKYPGTFKLKQDDKLSNEDKLQFLKHKIELHWVKLLKAFDKLLTVHKKG
ncbi:hypothetical protein P8452_38542 [Trifolium repens]|nr:hypothetical protein P8452_38542 [Trifolium repens]